MFIFLSFVLAIMSLYYLGIMADANNPDITYVTPLVALLIYSVVSIFRELRKKSPSWLYGNDVYDGNPYGHNVTNNNYNNHTYYGGTSVGWNGGIASKPDEKTEYFIQDNKEKKNDDVKELIHYPSNSEVRNKIKELEKSSWFRIKRNFAAFFAYDITEKYYKPTKTYEKVTPVIVNDELAHTPNYNWKTKNEIAEYNIVASRVSRSFEISFDEQINEDNGNN